MLIRNDSIWRQLPKGLDRQQAIFLDGLRHTAETCDLVYRRLQETLSRMAKTQGERDPEDFASAYADAWTFVDAANRFRMLWLEQPNIVFAEPPDGHPDSTETTKALQQVRDVIAHAATRSQTIKAHRSAAIGFLSWVTVISLEERKAALCTLFPGTCDALQAPMTSPGGKTIELPSGAIQLSAGPYRVDLSAVYAYVCRKVSEHEAAIEQKIAEMGITERGVSDVMLRLDMTWPADPEPA